MGRRVNDDELARMRELRAQGLSYREVGRRLGRHDQVVRYSLNGGARARAARARTERVARLLGAGLCITCGRRDIAPLSTCRCTACLSQGLINYNKKGLNV